MDTNFGVAGHVQEAQGIDLMSSILILAHSLFLFHTIYIVAKIDTR
jgi:hypothetical protein